MTNKTSEYRPMSNKWAAITTDSLGETTHVIPLNDLQDHILSQRCWCQPYEDPECDGAWIHSSADGRELYETGQLRMS